MSQTLTQDGSAPARAPSLSHRTALVLVSSAISQAAVAATYLLVARSTGPQEFGRVMAVVSLVLSAVGLLEFGTSTLLTREIAARRISLGDSYHGVFSRTVVMVVVAVGLGVGLRVLGRANTLEATVLALLAVTMTLSTGLQGVVRGLGHVQLSSWLGATDKVIGFVVVGVDLLWRQHASGFSLMLGLMLGPGLVSAFILLWLRGLGRNADTLVKGEFAAAASVGRRIRNHRRIRFVHPYRGAFSFGLTASVTSVQTLDTTAIASLAGTEAAGQFGAVSRWVGPLNLIVAAFGQAAFPSLAAEPSARQAFHRLKGGLWILALSWLAAVATAALSPWLVHFLLGDKYQRSASVLSLMALATIPAAISQVTLMLLQARGDEKRAAGRITAAVLVQLLLVSLSSLILGAPGAAAAILLTQSLLAAVLIVQVKELLQREGREAEETDVREH